MSTSNIIIGIVGHQTVESEMNVSCKHKVSNHLYDLRKRYDETMILLVPFSADFVLNKWIVNVAQEMGIKYAILLPVDRQAYVENIPLQNRDEFTQLCDDAVYVHSVGLYPGISLKTYFLYDMDQRYQNFVCQKVIGEKADEMIALWDGVVDYKIGSVSDAIYIRQKHFSKSTTILAK